MTVESLPNVTHALPPYIDRWTVQERQRLA